MNVYLAYITTGKEFEVRDKLTERGIACWIARKVDLVRRGKRRRPDVVVSPYWNNYAFVTLADEDWHDLRDRPVKHLAPTMHPLRRDDLKEFAALRSSNDEAYTHAMRTIESATKAELAEYRRGQAIKPISGSFADTLLRFRRIVESAHDLHPMIEAEMDLMGRVVRVKVDPLDVRAAE